MGELTSTVSEILQCSLIELDSDVIPRGKSFKARWFNLVRDKRYISVEPPLNDSNITKTATAKVSTPRR